MDVDDEVTGKMGVRPGRTQKSEIPFDCDGKFDLFCDDFYCVLCNGQVLSGLRRSQKTLNIIPRSLGIASKSMGQISRNTGHISRTEEESSNSTPQCLCQVDNFQSGGLSLVDNLDFTLTTRLQGHSSRSLPRSEDGGYGNNDSLATEDCWRETQYLSHFRQHPRFSGCEFRETLGQ